jgi:DNA polymerase-3 subunit chi
MTEIRFYHLKTQTVAQALPQILHKSLQSGRRVVIKLPDEKRREELNALLWTHQAQDFLPHGSEKDGQPARQPIWLTCEDENPNEAAILILTYGTTSDMVSDIPLCCEMLEDHDTQNIQNARKRWKAYKEQGFDITYWQQSAQGSWEKKA